MPIEIVDGFGSWDDLGIVQPVFEEWITFPDFSYSLSTLIRLNYLFEEFDQNSYGYIRCKYETANTSAIGRWIKFYPKSQSDFLDYPHPDNSTEFKDNTKLIFQVLKRHRFRRRIGTLKASLWEVNLNVHRDASTSVDPYSQENQDFPSNYFLGFL